MLKIDMLPLLVVAALDFALIIIFSRRKLYRILPFFFCFIVANVVISMIRLSVMWEYQTYFKVFWSTEAIYAVLTLLVLHEIFHEVFQAFFDAWWWFRLIFPATVLVTFGITIYHVLVHGPSAINLIISLTMANSYLQGAIFAIFFLLVWILGSGWDNYAFGVITGFAVSTAGTWLLGTLRSEFGTRFNIVWKYGAPVASFIAIVVWLVTFQRTQPGIKWALGMGPEQMLQEVRQYLKILRKALGNPDDTN